MPSALDFSDHESTVTVEREPTTINIPETEAIAKLKIRLRKLKTRNCDLDKVRILMPHIVFGRLIWFVQMVNYWKAEASKQEEYVELGRYAVNRLRSEIENLNTHICYLNDVSTSRCTLTEIPDHDFFLKRELSKEEGCCA